MKPLWIMTCAGTCVGVAGLLWLTDAAGTDRVARTTRADGISVTLAMPIGRNRTVTLSTADARRTLVLTDDTGWWRGAQLYRTADDGLLPHDGQGGCVILAGPARPCPLYVPTPGATQYPSPGHLPGVAYLGRFDWRDGHNDTSLIFLSPDDAPQVTLPDPL